SFITHHTMDMKIVYCDDNIEKLLGYKADELVGTSFYDYHHIYDSSSILNAFKTLFTKGQMVSGLYRFLAHNGGFAWVETQASLVKNPQTDKPQSVICISTVVSLVMK
ncbi:hypothetical protein HELRODRAFT_137338, partial [Helobdella robusta]|uniref:PAS domain-containing protein n=1 Tax=Helobdella robusta TaxID=6412 RepID=T1EIJ6_HELRO